MDAEQDPDQEHIDARKSQGFLYKPSGPVEQVFIEAEKAYDVRELPNPYLGLRAFTYEDREAYAGREALVQEALARLTDPTDPQILLFITGDSGSGKSSFAQAGLLPSLEAHYQKRHKTVRLAVFRPGTNPLATLADALSQLGLHFDAYSLSETDPGIFSQRLAESTPPDQVNLLVIDQFEEFFTQSSPEGRAWMFAFLSSLLPFATLHTHFIATLRSDYLKELFQSEALWQIAKGGIELRAMDTASLRLAILGPLEACGRSDGRYRLKQFEPELLERLAQDTGQEAAYLPLLQVTLEDLWQRGALTLGAYAGLGEAIRRRAEAVYAFRDFERVQPADPRPPEERAALLDLLLDQVEVSTDDDPRRDVRRRREKEDLVGDSMLRGRLVEDLTQARLLAVGREPHGETEIEMVDIIHESLIANWERMREAIAGRREQLKRRTRFEASLDEWLERGKSDDYLLSGVRLAEGRGLREAGDIALRSEAAQDFLKRSEAQAEAAHLRELDRERRRVRTSRIFTGAIGIVLVIALLLAGFAWKQQRLARSGELAAQAINQLEIDPERSMLLALEAIKLGRTFDSEDALRQSIQASYLRMTLRGHQDSVDSAQFSPDGKFVVTASSDGTARLWDADTGEALAVLGGHASDVRTAQFSPDGQRLVTASEDGTARVWETATGRELAVLRGHTDGVIEGQFSPDGTWIVTASRDGTAQLWEATTGQELTVLRGHEGEVVSAQFSPDGERVLTTDGNRAQIRDAVTGSELMVLGDFFSPIRFAEFSPDGKRVVTTWWSAILWDASTGQKQATLGGHENWITNVEFSPDGERVVTASEDGTARLYDAGMGSELAVLRGHKGPVTDAQFSPNGLVVVTASWDGTARLWDANTGQELAVLRGHEGPVTDAQFSPDGKMVVTASRDGTARLWEQDLAVLRGHKDIIIESLFSSDGEQVITVSWDNTARRWDASDGEELAVLGGILTWFPKGKMNANLSRWLPEAKASGDSMARLWEAGIESIPIPTGLRWPEEWVIGVKYAMDGVRLVTVVYNGTARLWNLTTGEELAVLRGHTGWIYNAQFSEDGTRVVTASNDTTARLWDTATGEALAILHGHEGGVNCAQFSPDGRIVVTASKDSTARLWDSTSGRNRTVLHGHEGEVTCAQFSPIGTQVVTASSDGTARLWDVAKGKEQFVLRGHEAEVNSAWFSPDGERVVTASDDGTARLWDANTGEMLAVLRGHQGSVNDAQFSPDGKMVVTAGDDGTARLYLVFIEDLIALAKSRVTRELTCEERVQYLHENLACPTPTLAAP